MKQRIGSALKQVRLDKQITIKELSTDFLSVSQLSHIEKGINFPSVEKFIYIISKLNIQYNEFISLIDDEYILSKQQLGIRLAEHFNSNSLDGLEEVLSDAKKYHNLYPDIFFKHIECVANSGIILLKTNNLTLARQCLNPIKDYLSHVTNWNMYEFSLLGNCLYVFDIDIAITLGNEAVSSIKKHFHIQQNKEIACTLLNNLAVYSLNYENHHLSALEFANLSEEISSTFVNTQQAITSNIICQVAYFKLKSSKFDKVKLVELLNTYKLLGWYSIYNQNKDFIEKHGVLIDR